MFKNIININVYQLYTIYNNTYVYIRIHYTHCTLKVPTYIKNVDINYQKISLEF